METSAKSFLTDRSFLLKVATFKVKQYLASIVVLDFKTEKPVATLTGYVVSGNMSINANSPTRRTGSMQVVFLDKTKDIRNIDNYIAIDKKIKLSVGFKNPFYHLPQYRDYGEDLWFPQGTFVITSANSAISATQCTVTMQFTDKMALLNGTAGGALPASVSFHESIVVDKDDNQITEYPKIKDIIREAVHHFGEEQFSKIIIDDVPDKGRQVVAWNGDTPLWLSDFSTKGLSMTIAKRQPAGYNNKFVKGEIAGYMETDLTYPGELIQKAGSHVQQVLDSIAKTLGNYEYFYDIDGNFRFKTIANYDKTGVTPLLVPNDVASKDSQFNALFYPNWNDDQFIEEFRNRELILTINQNPNYANIKNDFICWGTKQNSGGSGSGTNTAKMVRYHLAIDTKPKEGETLLCRQQIYKIYNKETEAVTRYLFLNHDEIPEDHGFDSSIEDYDLAEVQEPLEDGEGNYFFDWREELYRRALKAYGTSQQGSPYDEELIAEWRNIFDYSNQEFRDAWEAYYGSETPFRGYNVDVKNAPEKLRYWLDFIDSDSPIGQFSIDRIGRRTLAWEDSQINEVYAKEINDVVFVVNPGDPKKAQEAAQSYIQQGQTYCFIRPETEEQFLYKNSYGTCLEAVRQKLNENLFYNSTISLTCIPLFYLDVNKIIRLDYPDLGISGDYVINSISWQIGHNSTMSIQANEAITTI